MTPPLHELVRDFYARESNRLTSIERADLANAIKVIEARHLHDQCHAFRPEHSIVRPGPGFGCRWCPQTESETQPARRES